MAAEAWIENKNGKKLYCRYWSEEYGVGQPKALVFIAHGVAEHCLPYTKLAKLLHDKGFYVFSHDHIGHGQSEGDRVDVERFNQYSEDIFQHVDLIKEKFPDLPVFVIGHSMGGTISINSAMIKPSYFKGVILISPAVLNDPNVATPMKVFMGKMVSGMWPNCPVLKLNHDNLTRDTEALTEYKNDPLVYHGMLKARWATQILPILDMITEKANTIDWPFLVLHGTADVICDPAGAQHLYDNAVSKDKTIRLFEGYYHQLHNELGEDGAGVRSEIVDWIAKRI